MSDETFIRRQMLQYSWNGIGSLALGAMLASEPSARELPASAAGPWQRQAGHHRRRAKACIFIFLQGGVSQLDTFDHKPMLVELHGKPLPRIPQVTGELQGRLSFPHVCVASPFQFQQHGESGRTISELLPALSQHVDKMAFIHGIQTDNQNHGPATLHVTTGSQLPGSPSVGSWVSYGLGSENENVPGYVVIQDPRGAPVNGAAIWSNGYLPACYQGTLFRPTGTPILNLAPPAGLTASQQREELDVLRALNDQHRLQRTDTHDLDARMAAYELAFRMQSAAPELLRLDQEPQSIRVLYGLDQPVTSGFGRQCLLARRLVEAGVRFTLLVHGVQIGRDSWDDHGDIATGIRRHCQEVDRPITGLIQDLAQRGLLDETLVVWASEMGRTPFKNGELGERPGREHNSQALTMWVAGGNVRGGATVGQTDEFGLRADGQAIPLRDVHATLLDLLGLDDERLRFLHAGRWRQLTDIGGNVLHELIG